MIYFYWYIGIGVTVIAVINAVNRVIYDNNNETSGDLLKATLSPLKKARSEQWPLFTPGCKVPAELRVTHAVAAL
ncbi:MAG: hypothetical protein HQL80_04175 [Magnetococcales bacterium]|nr:hypothetical protein [Magnetococcales bacterium]